MTCPVYKRYCSEHNFVHGAEADELRRGIERLLDDESNDVYDLQHGLRRLLDRVDARDSLAFLEAKDDDDEEHAASCPGFEGGDCNGRCAP